MIHYKEDDNEPSAAIIRAMQNMRRACARGAGPARQQAVDRGRAQRQHASADLIPLQKLRPMKICPRHDAQSNHFVEDLLRAL